MIFVHVSFREENKRNKTKTKVKKKTFLIQQKKKQLFFS